MVRATGSPEGSGSGDEAHVNLTEAEIKKWAWKGLLSMKGGNITITEDGFASLMVMTSILAASSHPSVAPAAHTFLQTLQMATNDYQARSN